MKLLLTLCSLLAASSQAFVAVRSPARVATVIKAASTSGWKQQAEIPPTVKEVKGTNYRGDVMLTHSYYWPLTLAVHVTLFPFIYPFPIGVAMSGFHAILAALTWSQTNRVRVVMGKDSFELFNLANSGDFLKEKPSNYVKGGVNRWYYKDITDMAFWPSQKYPFIVYFKETATSREEDGSFGWWGKFAELHDPTANGKQVILGQPHFMPGLFDVDEFVDELAKHGVKPRENYWAPQYLPEQK